MGLSDRHYTRGTGGGFGGGGFSGRRILEWLNASFPIGTYLGIHVRVHITFILLLVFRLISEGSPLFTLQWTSVLFLSVLLHEFGHALACRSVGGTARDILMWPLGGLAFVHPPRRPWAEFVTVACGPLVNLVIAAAVYVTLLALYGSDTPVSLNPFTLWTGVGPANAAALLLGIVFTTNYILLLFNLALLFYPFDGGRLVQIALWTKMGYRRSMVLALRVGMGGAIIVGLVGLAAGELLLVLIAAFGFYVCYRQNQQLQHAGAAFGFGDGGPEFESATWTGPEDDEEPGFLERRRLKREAAARRREVERELAREQRVDAILQKVHDHGLQSLTRKEKRVLREASQRKRGS